MDRTLPSKGISLQDLTPQQRQHAIESCRTPAGGWTKETLAEWGVPWPPLKGWKKQLIAQGYYDSSTSHRFIDLTPEQLIDGMIKGGWFDDYIDAMIRDESNEH